MSYHGRLLLFLVIFVVAAAAAAAAEGTDSGEKSSLTHSRPG